MNTLLIVDDSPLVRAILKRIGTDLAFACSEAEDGEIALRACRGSMPDVILLDWNMPGLNGLDCMREIRAMPDGAKPKILLCTGCSATEKISEALDNGADEYIIKPFDRDILRSKLSEVGAL